MKKKTKQTQEEWVQETWNSYSPQIYNLCKSKCIDKEDAKDLFQNVALRFCQNASKIMYQESVFPWLVCVLRNCFYDAARRRNKEPTFSHVSDIMGDYRTLPVERSVFYKPGNCRNDELKRTVNRLPSADKELIDMAFLKGITTQELSSMYGVSFNAISKRRLSAIKRVRKVLMG